MAFDSLASNLVPGDTNDKYDVFVRDRCPDGSCVGSASVGGIAEQPDVTALPSASSSDRNYTAYIPGVIVLVAGIGGWYVRRKRAV